MLSTTRMSLKFRLFSFFKVKISRNQQNVTSSHGPFFTFPVTGHKFFGVHWIQNFWIWLDPDPDHILRCRIWPDPSSVITRLYLTGKVAT